MILKHHNFNKCYTVIFFNQYLYSVLILLNSGTIASYGGTVINTIAHVKNSGYFNFYAGKLPALTFKAKKFKHIYNI